MAKASSVQRVYPSEDGEGIITCPRCEKSKRIDVIRQVRFHKQIKTKCDCGNEFQIIIETRIFDRKKTRLQGTYTRIVDGETGMMRVEDLSYTGIKFITRFAHHIVVGDVVTIEFVLDNKRNSTFCKDIKICHVEDNLVGGEFLDIVFDRDLGAYLKPANSYLDET